VIIEELIVEPSRQCDDEKIMELSKATGVFSAEELDTVRELFDEYSTKGRDSWYTFLSCKAGTEVLGFSCFGRRPMTDGTFDLYWICTNPSAYRKGAGRALILETERRIKALGGRYIIVETSNLPAYSRARNFYEAMGYKKEAVLEDFYADGDAQVLFSKHLKKLL
jgi:ribosomal protein S18 acetylase RimI-like enzyme